MFDLDILLKDRTNFKRNVVYEYKESIFRADILKKVKDYFSEKGLVVQDLDYENPIINAKTCGFFGDFMFVVDVSVLKSSSKGGEVLEGLFKLALDEKFPNKFLFLFEEEMESEKYLELKSTATFIENQNLTAKTVQKFVKFVSIKYGIEIKNEEVLVKYLESWLKKTITQFVIDLDKTFVLCIDEEGEFNPEYFQVPEDGEVQYFIMHQLIFNYLTERSADSVVRIIKELSVKRDKEQAPTKMLISNIHKAIQELIYVSCKSETDWGEYKRKKLEKFASVPIDFLLKLNIMFARHEPELTEDRFLVVMNRILFEGIK